ncbi:MAG TPA: hypothetical protein VHU88_14230 [Sporichthyaceae bacterium]|nr:hypothetical protein [Sporichthyaceae bacterium]
MGVFKDTEEAERFLGAIWERMGTDAKLAPKLTATGLVMQLDYTEPDACVTVSCNAEGIAVERGHTSTEPQLTLFMTADTGNKFWLGEIKNIPKALSSGQIRTEGQMPNMMKLLPVLLPAFKLYRTILTESGRTDLIVD